MGGGDYKAPKPSKEERELTRSQLELLQQSRAESEMMKPYLLQSLGLVQETVDGQSSYRQMTEDEKLSSMSLTERANYDILRLQQDRMKMALEGKLPVSPALESEMADQEKMMREGLSRKLGTGWETTTPGIQALGEFRQKQGLLREESRRGELTSGQGILLSQGGYMSGLNQQNQAGMGAYGQRLFGLQQGYGQAQQPYQFNRQLEGQARQFNAQSNAWGGLGSLFGSAVSAYGTYAGLKAGGY